MLDAATVAVALACKAPQPARKLNVPDARAREQELVKLLKQSGIPVPVWLLDLTHDISRRNLLSALAAAAGINDGVLREALLGDDGLVNLWLRGRGNRQGLLDKIDNPGLHMAAAAQGWFRAAAHGCLLRAEEEDAEGRCHFTNAPVPRNRPIELSTGLYGVKVSAFSGREGRWESFNSPKRETLVSPLALAEHRLRSIRVRRPGGQPDVPILISSPTSAGLFASLVYVHNDLPPEFHCSMPCVPKTGNPTNSYFAMWIITFAVTELAVTNRYRAGWHHVIEDIGIITFVKMVFETAQRIGRPIHVFRGLPRPEPGYVSFDFLPEHLVAALGGTSFRIEQLPSRIHLLRVVEEIASIAGMGLELAARIADPETRFAAACDAIMRIDRMDEGKANARSFLRHSLLNLLEDKATMSTESDNVIVRFAESMSHVQRAPIRSDGDTVPEMGLREALAAVEAAGQLGQISRDSLIHAVMGSLDKELARKNLFSSKTTRKEATLESSLLAAAEIFVDDVWPKAFGNTSPPSRQRRIALAIYRMSFERAARAARGATMNRMRKPIMTLDTIRPYLGSIDKLLSTARDDKGKEYVQPALKNLGSVAIPLIREVIAPASFRNADPEITDILDLDGTRRVRAVANKFKYGERSRGLQVLRYFGAGGSMPQNRTAFAKGDRPSVAYDLNTIVFGDSANHGKRVLPVKAAAQYSDAVSIQPYTDCVDTSFHNRAAEDGTLFDAETKKNSSNIFDRHVLLPGTLLVQTISFNGRTAPPIAVEHLLLAVGLAGAYGGQTSIYGVNVRNHVGGIYAARFERDVVGQAHTSCYARCGSVQATGRLWKTCERL